jgi:hypothetical protein
MKFWGIFRFELARQLRTVWTWINFALLVVSAFLILILSGEDAIHGEYLLSGPYVIAATTVFIGVVWVLIAAWVAGEAAARDVQTGMHPLMYTTPVTKAEYLGGRFFAAFTLNALMLLAGPAGILLALNSPAVPAELVGRSQPAAYLAAYGFIALPFALVATGIQFSWATLNSRPMASYLASVLLLFVSQFVVIILAGVLESQLLGEWDLYRLFDVVGVLAIMAYLGDTWTALEKNTRLVELNGVLLANRLVWLGSAGAMLAFTYARFRFAHPVVTDRRRASHGRDAQFPAATPAGTARTTSIAVPRVSRTFDFATCTRQTLDVAGTSFRKVATSPAGLTIVAIFALGLVVFMPGMMQLFGVPLFPRTERVVGSITAPPNDLRTPLIIIPLRIAYPIRNEYVFFSANYSVHKAQCNDVAIEIYHHPRHTAQLDRMVRSIQASLTRFTSEFGPYPHRHIRFVERPGGGGGMTADGSSISYDEGFSDFNPDTVLGLDLPFYVVAHEVAHQWWGAQLSSATAEGAWLMSESLAVYSAMQVLRDTGGEDQLRRYLDFVRSTYEIPRSRAAVPLLRADNSFLGYRKGPSALFALSRFIGEDRVNRALRSTLEKHPSAAPPLPTSLDLYRELRTVTPDSLQYLLHDLFEANTYWELRAESVRADSTPSGEW